MDRCLGCPVINKLMYQDPESEYYFTCADCACLGCEYIKCCEGQCAEQGKHTECGVYNETKEVR